MNRRDFLKTAAIATAGMFVGKGMDMINARDKEAPVSIAGDMLDGVSDIHIHAAPDSVERSVNELDFVHDAHNAGYRAVMLKSNDFSCHDRAYLVRKAIPDFECFGSLVMNRVHGEKVNARAAEQAIKTTGHYCRCIWMPTLDAAYQYSIFKREEKGIPVLDESGAVLPEVVRVMEICAEADIIFATGHSSPAESLILAGKAKEVGVRKFVVTHANTTIWKMTPDQIRRCIDFGAFIEFSYITCLWGPGTELANFPRMSNADFSSFLRIAPERSFITTDLGQIGMPLPLDGMRTCISEMLGQGISWRDMDCLVRKNPSWLMGLDA